MIANKVRINHQIRSPELRVVDENGENLGVLPLQEAIKKASDSGFDLIEISPNAKPPVARIMDYGKFQYDQNKKLKLAKSKSHTFETKNIQVKIGTGEHDLLLKAKKASGWLKEGNRVKIELFLRGRAKYMEQKFLKERLERILKLITENFKVTEQPKKSLKGLSIVIEKNNKTNEIK